jgi:hypothetical protein
LSLLGFETIRKTNEGSIDYFIDINKGAMSCYGSFGVIFGAGAVVTCSLAQGACMVGCTPLLAAPTP